jgi:hypothetical protein
MPFVDDDIAPEERRPRPVRARKRATGKVNAELAADAASLGIAAFLLLCLAATPILPWLGIRITGSVFVMQVSASLSANAVGRTWLSDQSAVLAPGVDPKLRMAVGLGHLLESGSKRNTETPSGVPQGFGAFLGSEPEEIVGSGPRKLARPDRAWEGWTILGVSAALAILVALALAIYVAIRPGPGRAGYLISLATLLGGGWAVMTGIWLAGYICKIFLLRSQVGRAMEMAKHSLPENAEALVGLKISAYPSVGLWAGVFFAMGIAVVCAMLAARKPECVVAFVGYVAGLAGGCLMLAIQVKPWTVMN